jgi:hypothetical protein
MCFSKFKTNIKAFSDMREVLELNVSANSNLSDILFNIRLAGYGYVCIDYSGSGDSGSVDDVYLVKKENGSQDEDGVITVTTYGWQQHVMRLPDDIKKVIEDFVDSRILSDGADWYNSDGGGGTLVICTENGDYYDDRYVNIIEREDYPETGNLLK